MNKKTIITLVVVLVIVLVVLNWEKIKNWVKGFGEAERYNACGKCIEQQTISGNPDPAGWCSSTASGVPPKCSGGSTNSNARFFVIQKHNPEQSIIATNIPPGAQ